MNLDRRLGKQDADAATLFAAARSFRPSARGRRRTLRALGLPIGLSLFGSGLAHAAYLLSSSLKGWGLIAGVVASVGAAGGVTYVVTATPTVPRATRSRATANEGPAPSGRAATTTARPAASAPPVVDPPPLPKTVAKTVTKTVAVSVRRLAKRTEPRVLPSGMLDDGGGPSAPAPTAAEPVAAEPVKRLVERLEPPPFPAPLPASPRVVTSEASSLHGELALVAEAQARLRAGDARGAFAALDLHRRLYPNAALAEEVELLRLRAFIANGDVGGARKTGEAFLQRHPASPLGARFRSLLRALDVPAGP